MTPVGDGRATDIFRRAGSETCATGWRRIRRQSVAMGDGLATDPSPIRRQVSGEVELSRNMCHPTKNLENGRGEEEGRGGPTSKVTLKDDDKLLKLELNF